MSGQRASGDGEQPVLYAENGSSWWPLVWGPVLALAGLSTEAVAGGRLAVWLWFPAAVVLTLLSAVWVAARRRMRSVSLTPLVLRQGREELPVASIVDVGDTGVSMGSAVLGGSWIVPDGTDGVPLRLVDGRSVLAWARDAAALRSALRTLVTPGAPDEG